MNPARGVSDDSRGMKLGAIIGGIAGLGLAAWLLASYGVERIFDLLAHAGVAASSP